MNEPDAEAVEVARTMNNTEAIFKRLREQDKTIDDMKTQFSLQMRELREDLAPAITIIENFDGLSKFCAKWGRRIGIVVKWLGPTGLLWLADYFSNSAVSNWLRSRL